MRRIAMGLDGELCCQSIRWYGYYATDGQMRDDGHASLFEYDVLTM